VHVLHTKYKLLLVVCACSASVSSGTVGFSFFAIVVSFENQRCLSETGTHH